MPSCACGAEVDVAGTDKCRRCFIRTKLMPIVWDWLNETGDRDTRALRHTVSDRA